MSFFINFLCYKNEQIAFIISDNLKTNHTLNISRILFQDLATSTEPCA